MSGDLLRTSPTANYQTMAEQSQRAERSSSPFFSGDFARRIRAAITPPRVRRSKTIEFDTRPRSATASPCLTTATELIGGMPSRQKTSSCGELGRLENIFEPRLAPYTPPLRVRRGLGLENRSPSLQGMSDQEIEKLETKLFEPRDTACTPPLRRKLFNDTGSSDAEDVSDGKRGMTKMISARSMDSSSSEDSVVNEKVTDLQRMVFHLRNKAKVSSMEAVEQLSHMQHKSNKACEVTIRELEQLQHQNITAQQPNVVSCC